MREVERKRLDGFVRHQLDEQPSETDGLTAQVVAQVPVDVATFLLNEKRNDVLSIETRFKVNVLLVPNRHLETPNYTIERMRQDFVANASHELRTPLTALRGFRNDVEVACRPYLSSAAAALSTAS